MKKVILLAVLAGLFVGANAQPKGEGAEKDKGKKAQAGPGNPKISKEEKKHGERVTKSKKTGKACSSRDTMYCAGKPYCMAKEVTHNLIGAVTSYSFSSLKSSKENVKVTLESVSSGANAVYYWVWVQGETRFETEQKESPLDLICYYYVYKDTNFNIKNFTSLIANKAKIISGYNGGPAQKPKNDEANNRNRNDKLVFTGRDIRQSSVLIGHIESANNTTSGNIVTTYTVYNAEGSIVATAVNHGMNDHVWNIITANDKRNHVVTASLLHDQDEIVKYLVNLLYL